MLKRLNKEFKKYTKKYRYLLVDSTDISFDINLGKKYYNSEEMEEKKL